MLAETPENALGMSSMNNTMVLEPQERQKLQELRAQMSRNRERVTDGPFVYDQNGLKAKVEHDYLTYEIGRSSSDHLMYLLTYVYSGPALTKKGKPRVRQPPPHEDESFRFYKAQLLHYGLKPSSDKAGAKKALLETAEANGRELKVPAGLSELERELRQKYHSKHLKTLEIVDSINKIEGAAIARGCKKRALEDEVMLAEAFGDPPSQKKRKVFFSIYIGA